MCAVRWPRTQDPKVVGSPALALDPTTLPPHFLHAPLRAAFMTEKAHPPTPTRAQGSHRSRAPTARECSLGARRGPKSIRGAIMGGHNALYGGRECSLDARWLLVGSVMRAPAPLGLANVAGARPSPLPPRPPPPKRARLGRAVSGLWAGRFYAGARPFPLPPRPPPPICVRVLVCVCRCSVVVVSRLCWWSVAVLGAPRSACVLRALARMPHAARWPPFPASVPVLTARVVAGCALGGTWRAVGPSAFNAPARAPRAPSRLLLLAAGSHSRTLGPVFVTSA